MAKDNGHNNKKLYRYKSLKDCISAVLTGLQEHTQVAAIKLRDGFQESIF